MVNCSKFCKDAFINVRDMNFCACVINWARIFSNRVFSWK